jgi:hypothetical protein
MSIVTAACVAGALMASPASAKGKPEVTRPVPVSFSFVTPAGVGCDFAYETSVEGKVVEILFDDDRLFQAFPTLRSTITNLDTGASISIVDAGPAFISRTDNGDGTRTVTQTGTGTWTHEHGDGELTVTHGRFTHTYLVDAATFEILAFDPGTIAGNEADLCAALS